MTWAGIAIMLFACAIQNADVVLIGCVFCLIGISNERN